MGDLIRDLIDLDRPELVGLMILFQSQIQQVDLFEEIQSHI